MQMLRLKGLINNTCLHWLTALHEAFYPGVFYHCHSNRSNGTNKAVLKLGGFILLSCFNSTKHSGPACDMTNTSCGTSGGSVVVPQEVQTSLP